MKQRRTNKDDRLTEWIDNGEKFAIARQDLKVGNKDCLNKLAQHEDTGVDVIRLLDVPESDRERLAKNFKNQKMINF